MPKHQSTAARKARAAARRGAKFTPALRDQQAESKPTPSRERPRRKATIFDVIGSSAFKAAVNLANSPAIQAAQAAARANTAAAQHALNLANSPAIQMYRSWMS